MTTPSWVLAPKVRTGVLLLLLVGIVVVLVTFVSGEQDQCYHRFADRRGLGGIPNFLNVVSNLPFVAVGVWSLRGGFGARRGWLDALPEAAFVFGVTMTAFGSGYYHLAPADGPLVWDRLPMTLAFMGLSAAVFDLHFIAGTRRLLVVPLLALGLGSVVFWHVTGELRPYIFVQGLPLAMVFVDLAFVRKDDGTRWFLLASSLLYGLAKALEAYDKPIFVALGRQLSGHTLKHLAAAAASSAIVAMIPRTSR